MTIKTVAPYFTALALWPKGDGWGGGGLFPDNHSIELNHRPPTDERAIGGDETQLAPGFSTPRGFRTSLFGPAPGWGEDDPIYSAREARDGWTVATELDRTVDHGHDSPLWISFDPPGVVEKPLGRTGARLQVALHGIKERDGRWYVETAQIVDRADEVLADLGRVDWAGVDQNGDALYAQDGRLYRIAAPGKKPAPPQAPRLVADLNDLRFQRTTTPPEALVWPKSARAADFAKR